MKKIYWFILILVVLAVLAIWFNTARKNNQLAPAKAGQKPTLPAGFP